MFSNTLVSFVAAVALVGSVTAAVTPRWGQPQPQPGQSCSTGSLSCCASIAPFSSVSEQFGGLLSGLDPTVNADVPIGLDCILDGVAGWYCTP